MSITKEGKKNIISNLIFKTKLSILKISNIKLNLLFDVNKKISLKYSNF